MKTYPERIKVFRTNERFFRQEGFTFLIADRLIKLAFLDVWDIYHLFYFAKRIPNGGTYLEIGSWLGGSLLCAFLGTKLSNHSVSFIGIDLRIHTELFTNTKIIPDVRFIKTSSDTAVKWIVDCSVDLCFVDGAHHYAQVKRDFLNYWPKIKVNGILLGHDYSKATIHRGVVQAADEIFGKRLVRLPHSRVFMVRKSTDLLKLRGSLK